VVEVGAFGQEVSDQAVGLFVAAALPGRVRVSEVEGQAEILFELAVVVELVAVVGGGGTDEHHAVVLAAGIVSINNAGSEHSKDPGKGSWISLSSPPPRKGGAGGRAEHLM